MTKICPWCEEEIADNDKLYESIRPSHHYECGIRMVMGSVAHQTHRCGCYVPGSTLHDREGVSVRQAARDAMEMFYLLRTIEKAREGDV